MCYPARVLVAVLSFSSWLFIAVPSPVSADDQLRKDAEAALTRVLAFYDGQLSVNGGYLWRYSADLSQREGERPANASTAWVQPPGTPTVGMAWLQAYRRCRKPELLAAARRTAAALVQGQLLSGGWTYSITFDPPERKQYAFRTDAPENGAAGAQRPGRLRNTTTLDDNTTQSALRFLMELDLELQFKDPAIHEAVHYALDRLIAAQYPNGAWPQRFEAPPEAEQFPIQKAQYPASWPRAYPGNQYAGHYTFNDNSLVDAIDVFFLAHQIYGKDEYRQTAIRGGDFLLLAQMPEPQPAWAQQYNAQMEPAWARRFEPPSVTGGESQRILSTLISIYRHTGDRKYLEPIPRAIAYLRRSLLPDGRLARFYELKTNRPLYLVRDTYELTYDDSNLPTHYGFKVGSKLDAIEAEYERVLKLSPEQRKPQTVRPRPADGPPSRRLEAQVRTLIDSLDERGAWLDPNQRSSIQARQVIQTQTFIRNIDVLAHYLGTRPQ